MSESNPDYYAIERALLDVLARASAALSQQLSPSTPPASASPDSERARSEPPELKALVDAVEGLLDSAVWCPASDICTPEMLVNSFAVSQLQAAYNAYVETYASAPSGSEGASA